MRRGESASAVLHADSGCSIKKHTALISGFPVGNQVQVILALESFNFRASRIESVTIPAQVSQIFLSKIKYVYIQAQDFTFQTNEIEDFLTFQTLFGKQ